MGRARDLLYVIGQDGGPYMIGSTSDVLGRLDALRSARRRPLAVLLAVSDDHAAVIERRVRRQLAPHKRGDWYGCTLALIRECVIEESRGLGVRVLGRPKPAHDKAAKLTTIIGHYRGSENAAKPAAFRQTQNGARRMTEAIDRASGGALIIPLPTAGKPPGLLDRQDVEGAFAENTKRAYAGDWRDWEAWCATHGNTSLPADPEWVRNYVVDLIENRKRKVSVARRRLASIAEFHKLSGHQFDRHHPAIHYSMRRLSREHGTKPKGRAEIMTSDIERMLEIMPRGRRGLRDRAMLLIGYAGGFRRSELVSIDMAWIEWRRDGIVIKLPRSKGDQQGEGQEIGILYGKREHTCPVRALKRWLEAGRITSGPIFRAMRRQHVMPRGLTPQMVWSMVKRYATRAGLDGSMIGAHSLRVGHVTQALENGAMPHLAQSQMRHKRIDTTMGYDRNKALKKDNTSGKLGL